jgi:hypothetical protein
MFPAFAPRLNKLAFSRGRAHYLHKKTRPANRTRLGFFAFTSSRKLI